jgi:type I restriction enzyme S subunit
VDFDPVRAKAEGRDPVGVPPEVADLFPDVFDGSKLGQIPSTWSVEQLGNHLTVLETGRRPKGGVGDVSEGVPSIGAESIIRIGQFDYGKTKYVTHDFFDGMRSGKLVSRDVLLYKDGGKPGTFLPRVSMFGDGFPFETCGINEHVFRIRTGPCLSQAYLYFWLWSDIAMHELKHRGGKAAIPGINQADVREIPVLLPSAEVLAAFNEVADPAIARILSNAKEIRVLEELRDTLLPRLMSGKLRISDIEEVTE